MGFRKITSSSNPHIIKAVRIRKRLEEREGKTLIIEGRRIIESAIDAGAVPEKVFFTGAFVQSGGRPALKVIAEKTSMLFEVTESIMKKITDTESPQGIAAVVSYNPPSISSLLLNREPLLVVIDGIGDPGNLGAIIRTSDAAGADAVVLLPGTCDVFMPKAVRATAGSLFNIPVVFSESKDLLQFLSQRKIRLAVTAAGTGKSVFDAALCCPIALVFGNEARGVSKVMRDSAELSLRIPIYGKAESLNVAASAAVCIYETVRQKRAKQTNP